ncbi:MAG: glycosyltransferase [Candidatus Micrarchaeia archaeon]
MSKILVIKGEGGSDIWENVKLGDFGIKKIVGEKTRNKEEKIIKKDEIRVKFKHLFHIRYFFFLFKQIPKEKPEIVIVKRPFPTMVIPAIFYKLFFRKKFFMHFDEWEINKPFRPIFGFKNIALFIFTYISIAFADAFIVGNENLKKLIKTKKKFFYLPNGAIPWMIKPANIKEPKNKIYCLYIGGSYRKVQEPMYRTFAKLKNAKLFVAGKVCRELGERKNVVKIGEFKFEELSKIASRAHVLLATFDYHWHLNFTSNVKIFDYMCLRMPIVASSIGEIPKYLDYGKAGYLIQPGNMQQLRSILKRIKENYREAFQKAKYARKLAETKYDRRKLIRNFINELNVWNKENEEKRKGK